MIIGIMQPYLFPYIGYFQLIKAVDKFVIYDDVNYINRGWINRNRILVGGEAFQFTVPLKDASQNKLINEIEITSDASWKKKLLKTIQQSYQKAPQFQNVYQLIQEIITPEHKTIAALNLVALLKICEFIKLDTEIVSSSTIYQNSDLKASERILDICLQEKANGYINAIGGMELYDKEKFEKLGVKLNFIKSLPISYRQIKNAFIPWLSMIDILMFNDYKDINSFLDQYELI